MDKTIFLVDMNAFYISCEEKLDNSLRNGCAAVAGDPSSRTGIILTANYNARKFGVKTTMTVSEAKKLCPQLRLVKPDHELYSEVSKRIMSLLSSYTPLLEQNSIDEAWIDMTGADKYYAKTYKEIAKDIREDIYRQEEVPCSIGISYNKFLAKTAAEMIKPNGIVQITKDNFREMIWPMPVGKMYGCGKVTAETLHTIGIDTIGGLAACDPFILRKKVGNSALTLYNHANGMDGSELESTNGIPKSISRETTFSSDLTDIDDIEAQLYVLADDVARQARLIGCAYSTVYITLKFNDFTKITRQRKLKSSEANIDIRHVVSMILRANHPQKPVRLAGAGITDITDGKCAQLELFQENKPTRLDEIYKVIDEKNNKYGTVIIKRGAGL